MKVVDKIFTSYNNGIIIETNIDDVKHVFDIRIHFDSKSLEVTVCGIGVKKGRERNFQYPTTYANNCEYRALESDARRVFERDYYASIVPKEVLNLAIEEYVRSIKPLYFE